MFGKVYLLLTILALVTITSANRDAVCLQAEALYRTACLQGGSSLQPPTTIQGSPGKRGQKGEVGRSGNVGVQGPPGIVDYERVDSLVQEKFQQAMAKYDARIDELTNSLSSANERIRLLESREGICGVKYEGKCFWLEIRYDGSSITHEQGRHICSVRGGHPANIYSEAHYGEITRYIRAQMPEGKDIFYVWLGMLVDFASRRITLSDGSTAPFLKWHEGHPMWRSDRTNMGMHVRNPPNLRSEGMYDMPPTSTRLGIVCQL